MLDPDDLYTVDAEAWSSVAGTMPTLVHLLDGFVDAGNVGGEIAERLLADLPHRRLATFDHDQLHDYRSRRPTMTFDTDTWVAIEEFELVLWAVTDVIGEPFVLLTGPEPDNQWVRARAAVVGLCRDLGVRQSAHVFGMPTGTPHTRPSLMTVISDQEDLTKDNPVLFGRMDIPASFSAALELALDAEGIETAGVAVHVPHYLAHATFARAALAGMERLGDVTGLSLPTGPLAERVEPNLADIDAEMAESTEIQAVVTKLEEHYDEQRETQRGPLPSADEIGAELERFLAERNRKDGED